MLSRTLITSLMLPILFGCASQLSKYVVSEGAATANLRSVISGADSRHDSIDIYASEGTCDAATGRGTLFHIKKSKSDPDGFVKVAANQPLRLQYREDISGGRACSITLEVNFEEGKSYSLVGGFEYESGPIPILTGTRMCQFGVQDDKAQMPMPFKKCS